MKRRGGSSLLLAALLAVGLEGGGIAFDRFYSMEGVGFRVISPNRDTDNRVRIVPSGFSQSNRPVTRKIEGIVTDAQIADLNEDGAPEIYIFVHQVGSGVYGTVVAYASNRNRSMSEIAYREFDVNDKRLKGYMGHDQFCIDGDYLLRRFPLYREEDPNCCPTGGLREIEYELRPGEAMWQLVPVEVRDWKK